MKTQVAEKKMNDPVEAQANELLECHPYFRGRSKWVKCRIDDGCLQLNGRLPSYFLKQVAQEILRQLPGVDRIENRIVVTSIHGDIGPNENRTGDERAKDLANPAERLLAHHLRRTDFQSRPR